MHGFRRAVSRVAVAAIAVAMLAVGHPFVPPAGAAAPTFGIASSVEQVRPDATAGGRPTSASLVAARNEFESFQIVVQGPATGVSVTGNLFGWNTTTLYRVDYYTVVEPSDGEGGVGKWGDILIPERDVIYGEDRNAFPFNIPAAENRVIWVDQFVPPGTAAGTYNGNLTLSSAGGSVGIPVTLEVLGIDLPSTSSMQNAFFVFYNLQEDMICRAHTGDDACGGDAALRRLLHSMYSRIGLENRLTLSNGFALRGNQSPAFHPEAEWESTFEAPLIRGTSTVPAGAAYRLSGARETTVVAQAYRDYQCLQACTDQWEAEANEAGQVFADRMLWYGCDEAGGSQPAWQVCKDNLSLANAGWVRPALATSSIANYNAAAVPTGIQISTLVPIIREMHPKGQPDKRADYDSFLSQPGRALWLYSSCESHGCADTPPGSPDPYYDGWPGYAIDAPANQSRAMSWLVRRYRATGELYYAAQGALAGGWSAGGLFKFGVNGDGTLFYPGTVAKIGGAHDIPLESARLKRIRDGREDYEHMKWLDDHGSSAQVDGIVNGLYPTASSATAAKDGAGAGSLLAARTQLVNLIRAKTGAAVRGPGRIAFSSDRDGDFDIFTMDPDGSDVVQITNDPAVDRFPAWSPDGRRIAWSRGPDVWVMDANGANPANLTSTVAAVASKPAWSADGSKIVYVSEASGPLGIRTDLHKMAADGTGKTELVTYSSGGISSYDPSVSPNDVVFFTQGSSPPGLYRIGLDGIGFTRVTSDVDEVVDVSDGGRLTFSRSVGGSTPYDVLTSNLDGSGGVNLTATAAGGAALSDFQSSFSPGSDRVAFASAVGGDLEIWTIGTDATGAGAITANTSADLDPDWGPTARSAAGAADFDGNALTDVAVFRPGTGVWYVRNGSPASVAWGTGTDVPAPGDYDGDKKTDMAVFRPSNGVWFIRNSSGGGQSPAWGVSGDIPVPGDYDGDGKTDLAVYRPSNGVWFIQRSTGGGLSPAWGTTGDVPVPADYDGDGKTDIAVYRPSNGVWFILRSTGGGISPAWGTTGDIPVPADYDGDGKTDVAVYRPSNGVWFIQRSTGGGLSPAWGVSGDIPVPGDYDGDGKAEVAVFRPGGAVWFLPGVVPQAIGWGAGGDVPIPLPPGVRLAFFP